MPHTSPKSIPLLPFLPPGRGEWRIIDHITHPGTRFFAEYYYGPMETGWNEEAESIGTLNRVKIREVNGFMYYQMEEIEAEQQIRKMCRVNQDYWEEKRFLSRLREWDEVVKPAASRQLLALQETKLDQLSTDRLIEYVDYSINLVKQMVKNHHSFTYSAFIPLGDFVRQVSEWTGENPVDVLTAIKGSNPGKFFMPSRIPVVQEMMEEFQKNTIALYLLSKADREQEDPTRVLKELLECGGCIKKGLRYILQNFGYRVISGYDISAETFIERPDILLKALKSIPGIQLVDDQKGIQRLREKTPPPKRQLFDEILSHASPMQRLREERGMYTDLWAVGILRHVILEAGRRLAQNRMVNSHQLALDVSPKELIELLRGNAVVSSEELQLRADYRLLYSVAEVPPVLGSPTVNPPDPSHLPIPMKRTMAGLGTAMKLAIEHLDYESNRQDVLVGTPASRGIVVGQVRTILSEDQVKEIQRGDILVVRQTTASFNVVFPLIGGIVSQFGGVLSHPAILAREYGIPCVVGCSGAVEHLRTGMQVRLDGDKGEITIIQKDTNSKEWLKALLCDYVGPMQGRNRDRVFNHIGAVSEKITFVEKIRQDEKCRSILLSHFNSEIYADQAAAQIIAQLQGNSMGISSDFLQGFIRREHVEFHPCDACNLKCSGCTYFQDTPLKPDAVSFPYESLSRICSLFQPKAITLVGGGEPTLYISGQHKLGDLICALGQGEFGCTPDLGLISNGALWPPGNNLWHHYVKWVRYSLDSSTPDSYTRIKGKDYFEKIVDNVFRILMETNIPQVGVGFLYHPGNIAEAVQLISFLTQRVRRLCPDQVQRLNVQFRPWRMPMGRPSIKERILSNNDIEQASAVLLEYTDQDAYVKQFARQNTNIAINLLCGRARENVKPFAECYFGLAKTVVRADGALYPCFRMAATRDAHFSFGNILLDTPLSIALKELYVTLFSARQICVPEHDKCLFCVFNNALETGLTDRHGPSQELAGDYFF